MANPFYANVAWDSVTVLKKKPPPITNKKVAINKAIQQGEQVDLTKKFNAGANKHYVTSLNTAKLDSETEKLSHNKVGLDTGRAIQAARAAKGWNRQEFATKICERLQVVNEFESGAAIMNNQILAKMEKALGVRVRGKDKGKPIQPPAPKASTSKTAASGGQKNSKTSK